MIDGQKTTVHDRHPAIEDNTVPGNNPVQKMMPGGGKRIYVGALNPTEANPRNMVLLQIKTTTILRFRKAASWTNVSIR